MKYDMKATLLIKNIKNLYTCNEKFEVISDAFIAIHHEYIIDFGTHNFKKWMDSSTRVIDAAGECVVPAFIDSCFQNYDHVKKFDRIRNENELAYLLRSNGILTMVTPLSRLQRKDLFQDIVKKKIRSSLPILSSVRQYNGDIPQKFLLSCGTGQEKHRIFSMHPLAFYFYNFRSVSASTLLKSMTCWPAQTFDLPDRGVIAIGKRADLLVLHVKSIEEYLNTLGVFLIRRMIKNGIQVYPDIVRC